jgi:hypothetical protein
LLGVDIAMALAIILFDVLEVGNFLETIYFPVEMFQVAVQHREIMSDGANIQFEVYILSAPHLSSLWNSPSVVMITYVEHRLHRTV